MWVGSLSLKRSSYLNYSKIGALIEKRLIILESRRNAQFFNTNAQNWPKLSDSVPLSFTNGKKKTLKPFPMSAVVAVLKEISTAESSSSSSSAPQSTITDRRSVLAWETGDTFLWSLSWQSLALVDCGGVMIVQPWGRKEISIIATLTSFKSSYSIIKFKSILKGNRFECTTYLKMLSLLYIWFIYINI